MANAKYVYDPIHLEKYKEYRDKLKVTGIPKERAMSLEDAIEKTVKEVINGLAKGT